MRRHWKAAAAAVAVAIGLAVVAAVALSAAQSSIPPVPTRWVTDTVAFMTPGGADQLNARLRAYEEQTGHQLLVWIGDSTGNVPIEDFAVRTFESWKVGRKGIDDGLALFIMAKDRRLRIEVGYGLEGEVPDAIASRIINDVIVPRIRSGDPDVAVSAGMEAVAMAIGGPPLSGSARNVERPPVGISRPPTLLELIFFGIIGLLVLGFLATHPSLAVYLLLSLLSGGNRRGGGGGGWSSGGGGGGWGGGGWSGGGGRSGGGGASGSW